MIHTRCQVSTDAGSDFGTIVGQMTLMDADGSWTRGWWVSLDCGCCLWAADGDVFPLVDLPVGQVALGGRC